MTTATDAAKSGIFRLPTEIRDQIVGYLEETADLINVRLALRGASIATEPRLFDRVYLSLSTKSLGNAENIIRKYGRHVKEIDICPSKYEPYSQSAVPIYNIVKRRITRPATRQQEHFDRCIANYYKNERLTAKILDSALLGTQLLLALNKIPHTPRIVFTAKYNPKYTDVEWHEVSVRTKS